MAILKKAGKYWGIKKMQDNMWIKIGLEVHVQIGSLTKMYCRCQNDNSDENPNTRVCPTCLGLPGSLPVLNERVIEMAARVAFGLGCRVNNRSKFDRKNYFYPDLPKGYQITQYFLPLAQDGMVELAEEEKNIMIRINRLHLEEDTAKMIHAGGESLLDFNRCGIPLMEIVTEPDFVSSGQAVNFLKDLRDLVRWLGVSQARMQHGELRCDANISLWQGKKQLGEVVEIKNLNSLKNVKAAIEYEFVRQKSLLAKGIRIGKETRGWNAVLGETVGQREKEKAHDYRYFPEPDLPELEMGEDFLAEIKKGMPILPEQIKERMQSEYFLDKKVETVFFADMDYFDFFEKVVSELKVWLEQKRVDWKERVGSEEVFFNKVAGYVLTDFRRLVRESGGWKECRVTPENFAELVAMFLAGEINNQIMKKILTKMIHATSSPLQIAEENGWLGAKSQFDLDAVVEGVIVENGRQVNEYKQGKEQLLAYFLGQVMKKTGGLAKPDEARAALLKKLRG